MIGCPYCDRTFSSDGSYRVHKYRFHRELEFRQPVVIPETKQAPLAPAPAPEEPKPESKQEPAPETQQPENPKPEDKKKGDEKGGSGLAWAILALVVGVVAAIWKNFNDKGGFSQ